jgi:hypothetical protein
MHSAAAFAEYLSDALILLTAASAANAVWRRRDTHRLDILAFVAALAVADAITRPAHRVLWTMGTGLWLAQPYLLLRLVRHFRDVPAVVLRTALAVAIVGMLVLSPPPLVRPRVSDLGIAVYLFTGGMYSYAALAFSREAARTAGVTARRLAFAAAGSWAFVLVFAIATAFMVGQVISLAWGQVNQYAHAGALACYFLAFTTPRRLRATWQRAEQARYLSATADRDPEDRGRRAPSDLLEAAKRSVGHSLILVALRPLSDAGPFIVGEATDRGLVGTTVDPSSGVVGRVAASKAAEMAARRTARPTSPRSSWRWAPASWSHPLPPPRASGGSSSSPSVAVRSSRRTTSSCWASWAGMPRPRSITRRLSQRPATGSAAAPTFACTPPKRARV